MNHRFGWGPADDARLRCAVGAGEHVCAIAGSMGRPVGDIIMRAEALGLSLPDRRKTRPPVELPELINPDYTPAPACSTCHTTAFMRPYGDTWRCVRYSCQ